MTVRLNPVGAAVAADKQRDGHARNWLAPRSVYGSQPVLKNIIDDDDHSRTTRKIARPS
jgi:hypothetical protein